MRRGQGGASFSHWIGVAVLARRLEGVGWDERSRIVKFEFENLLF